MDIKSFLNRSIKWWYLVIVGILILDLVTKAVFDGQRFDVIPGFFSVQGIVHNTGASYGIFSDSTFAQVVFILLGLVFATMLIAFDLCYKKPVKKNVWYKLAFVLLIGGLLGNLIDRVALGYVRDFIHLDFMSFPVFNIADVALTCGCVAFVIYVIFSNPFSEQLNKAEQQSSEVKANNIEEQTKKPESKRDEDGKTNEDKDK
jgi:signal peptidase II